ncbi:quinol oxidase [Paramagnetospirillum kuznetsovii]|uniref:Quinol oxidase n=1 Tax=Paramagnetospirillum kuznetsovii TaxID=2053833 RepID=A0A364NVU8_9PROT|nr:quinol oxidase [Paramagnetospirillum kuznetsovii]RAU21219.1 quinol oxidase [Paramagnetospirillum kuznetsovii]
MNSNARAAASALLLATILLLAGWLAGRTGADILPAESYAANPIDFVTRTEAMIAASQVGRTAEGMPVVRPPPGDVYVRVRRWEFSPALELAPGQTYRLHLLSEDVVHSAAIGDAEVLLEPNTVKVVTLKAPATGRVRIQCGEYCGLGHTKMIGSIEAVP